MTSTLAQQREIKPRSLNELLGLSSEELALVDIGRANLLCAEGLPGAEELDVEEHVDRLDAWAQRVSRMTQQHLPGFPTIAEHFDNSEPKWRLCAMAKVLHEECNVAYNEARIHGEPDWSDSQDLLIHGITGSRRAGTCPSLPVFFVAIGRRLGYPMHLSKAPAHCFSRWEALDHDTPNWRDCFNIEFHGHVDFHDDESYYDWPLSWPSVAREQHRRRDPAMTYLQSLPPAEEFAHSLCQRAICLEASGQFVEAVNVYNVCGRYDQRWEGYQHFAKRALRSRAESVMRTMGYEPEAIRYWAMGEKLAQAGHLPTGKQLSTPPEAIPQRPSDQPNARFERPPSNLKTILNQIIHMTCEGTSVSPSFDLLFPHPPEPKVDPYGSRSQSA